MKVTLITGDHPRHHYFASKISDYFPEIFWVIQKREEFIPKLDKNLNINLQRLQTIHFEKRSIAENNFFDFKSIELVKKKINRIKEINKVSITNGDLKKIILNSSSEILITYGCSKIPEDILNLIKLYKWNVHGGISPRYRGVITHFWPSYLLEPEFTGMTLHETTNKIDGGNIIHQTSVDLNAEDGIHENACRTVKAFCDAVPALLKNNLKTNKKIIGIPQKTSGRIWTHNMWSPILLKMVYEDFGDRINRYCIENKKIVVPKLQSVFI